MGSSNGALKRVCATIECPSSPNGLLIPGWSGKGPGLVVTATLVRIITAPANHANGRHLLEGYLPSGNSRIR